MVRLRLVLGHIWENISIVNIRDGHWKDFQITNPLSSSYSTVEMVRNSFLLTQDQSGRPGKKTLIIESTNSSDPLKAGEVISFIIGDTRQ